MKAIVVVITGIALIVMFESFINMSTNKTEEQNYKLVKDYGDFEIRFYPSAILATIHSNAKTYQDLSGPGFRRLAGYIFGGNEANQKIAMTTPVHIDINDSSSAMSFVMPSSLSMENLPQPNDSNVRIGRSAEEYVAVMRYGGFTSDEVIRSYSTKLQALLAINQIKAIGNYRFFGYSSPYQLTDRRNEIIVAVEWKE